MARRTASPASRSLPRRPVPTSSEFARAEVDPTWDSREGTLAIQALRYANLALRFLLELVAFGALGYWGLRAGDGPVQKAALGLGAPVLAALVWGLFVAPRARVSLPLAGRLAVELAVFGSGALALFHAGHPALAVALATLAAANRALIHLWRQDERAR